MKSSAWILAAVVGLAACTEKPQTVGGRITDDPAHKGTGKAYTDSGWKPGDKTSWEQHLKARGQYGQNDYSRTN